jgi:hypothetical protein
MKRLIYILTIAIFISAPVCVYGQNANDDPIIAIFSKYEDREGVESVTISPALFGLMSGRTNDSRTQELISKITGLRILTLNDGADGRGRANREALTAELQTVVRRDFEEIMKVNSSGERIELYVRNRSTNSALLFITSATNSVTVLHLAGTIDKTLIDAVMSGEIGITK